MIAEVEPAVDVGLGELMTDVVASVALITLLLVLPDKSPCLLSL